MVNNTRTELDVLSENIQHNVKQEQLVLKNKKWIKSLRDGGFNDLSKFICIFSGVQCKADNYVSPAVVRFFDYDVRNVSCHACQEANRKWLNDMAKDNHQADTHAEQQ